MDDEDDIDDLEAIVIEQRSMITALEDSLVLVRRDLAEAMAEITMLKHAMEVAKGRYHG